MIGDTNTKGLVFSGRDGRWAHAWTVAKRPHRVRKTDHGTDNHATVVHLSNLLGVGLLDRLRCRGDVDLLFLGDVHLSKHGRLGQAPRFY